MCLHFPNLLKNMQYCLDLSTCCCLLLCLACHTYTLLRRTAWLARIRVKEGLGECGGCSSSSSELEERSRLSFLPEASTANLASLSDTTFTPNTPPPAAPVEESLVLVLVALETAALWLATHCLLPRLVLLSWPASLDGASESVAVSWSDGSAMDATHTLFLYLAGLTGVLELRFLAECTVSDVLLRRLLELAGRLRKGDRGDFLSREALVSL